MAANDAIQVEYDEKSDGRGQINAPDLQVLWSWRGHVPLVR